MYIYIYHLAHLLSSPDASIFYQKLAMSVILRQNAEKICI